ncbi:MAG: metal-dependent hydrolase [Methanoregulaceae archaeon]
MFIFAHLFVGCTIAFLLSRWFRDKRLLIVAAIAAILPDILDKPVGHILLAGSLNNGRIFFHGLLGIATILIIVILIWRIRILWIIPAVIAGLLSHQLLDAMWEEPVTWYFPLFGPFQPALNPDYFMSRLLAEITNPSEWLLFFSCILLVSSWFAAWPGTGVPVPRIPYFGTISGIVAGVFLAGGIYSLATGLAGSGNILTRFSSPVDNLIMAALLLWGGIIFLELQAGHLLPQQNEKGPL